MSNIKTRKGLAFGALVALGASLIAGAPAHAAGELNVVPAAGSLLSTLSTEAFTLNTNFTGANATPTTTADLRYQVKSASAIQLGQGNSEVNAQNNLGNVVLTDGAVDVASSTQASANNFLAVALQSAAANGTVEVTAYVDSNNSLSFTAGEWSTVQTISFKTLASVTKAVNLDTPHTDDVNVTGQVTLEGINLTQIQSGVSVEIANYDSTNRVYNSAVWATVTASTLKFTYAYGPLASGANISARAYLGEDETAFASAIKKVVAHTVLDITSTVVAGPNAHADGDVRANSPYAVTATVWDTTDVVDRKGVAGAAVKATIGATLPVTAATPVARSITINGTTYTTQADLDAASIALTSDANGKVTLNVTTVGFVNGDVVTFHFVSENLTSTVNSVVIPVVYQLIDSADKHNNNWRSAVAGSTLSIAYSVVDQFGQAPANGKYAVVVGEDALDGIVEAHADVVNGVATVSVVVPATPATTVYDVAAELFIYGTEHSFVTAEGTNILEPGGFNVQVAASNEVTASTVAITYVDTTPDTYAIDEVVFSNVDGRYAGLFGYNDYPTEVTSGDWAHFTAVVKAGDVATHTIAGAPVTISAPGLLIGSGDQWGVGTLTVLADVNGFVDFYVTSHTAGKQTVTVTSGAASASKESRAWVANAAKAVTAVVASASYTTGRAVLVEFTAVDEYGNAASSTYGTAKASITGAGYLVGAASNIGSTVDVAFSAGKGGVQLVNGADQIGTATVTLTLPTAADKSVTASSTYTFGQTDANLNISGKRVTADWVFAAGKTVTITRNGVTIRTFHPTANSADSFSFNLKKSKKAHRVTIKINGVTITDAGYLVKK